MKIAKKLAAAVLAAVMVCGSGCSNSEDTGAGEFTPKLDTNAAATLNIIGGLQNFEALEAVITDFGEYYPNVEVVYSYLDDYNSNIEARIASDSSVGIFQMKPTNYDVQSLAEACEDLRDCIDTSDVRENVVDSVIVDGKMYCLPLALNANGMAVNVTLLEKYDLETPTNYSEFLNCCKVLKENGYTPIQGFSEYNSISSLMRCKVYCDIANTEEDDEDIINSMKNAEDGCTSVVTGAYEIVKEIFDNGYMDLSLNLEFTDSYNDVIMRFFNGDVPFMLMTSEGFSGTKKRETKSEYYSANPFEYVYICTPFAEDDGYSYIENWVGFSVNKNCTDKEWAEEFMRFLATKDELNTLASIKNMPSVAKESDDSRFERIYTEHSENTAYNSVFVPVRVEEAIVEGALAIAKEGASVEEAEAAMLEYLKENPSDTEE